MKKLILLFTIYVLIHAVDGSIDTVCYTDKEQFKLEPNMEIVDKNTYNLYNTIPKTNDQKMAEQQRNEEIEKAKNLELDTPTRIDAIIKAIGL